MRSSSVSSAQCTSSTTATSGRRRASASKSFRIAQNVSSTGTGGPARPSAGADALEDLRGARIAFEQRRELAARDAVRRAVGEAGRLAHGLGDRRERDAFAVREAVTGEHLPLPLDVLRQLADQPRLASPGRGDDGGDADVSLFTGAPPELEELRELVLTPDQRRMQIPPDPGRAGEHIDETPRRHGLCLPLECERLDRLDSDRVAHEPQRRLAKQHLPRRRGLLEARRDVHGVAARERLSGRRVAGHDLPRVHADAHGDPRAVASLDITTELAQAVAQLGSGAHATQRVVLAHVRNAERGHDRVPDEFLDGPAVPLEHLASRVEELRHHPAHGFRVEPFAECRRAGHVCEHEGDDLARLVRDRLGQLGAAEPAQAKALGILLAAARADHGTSVCESAASSR